MTDLSLTMMRKGPPKQSDAVDRIAPDATVHEMRDAYDIGDALSMLAQTGEAITVYPPGRRVVMARIEGIDPERRTFTLDLVEDSVLDEGRAVFLASLGGNAKIQFELDANWTIVPGQAHLVELPVPVVCHVLNRRAEPRLDTPVGVNFGARLSIANKLIDMPLYDFSNGGVGLRASPDQAVALWVGKKLENVQIQLGNSLAITADLEVRLLRPFRTFLLGQQVQVGCRISNISMQMRQSLERAVSTVQRRK